MSYYKKIFYVDCYKDDVKMFNAGFVRLLKKEDITLQIHLSNNTLQKVVWSDVRLLVGESSILLGRMELANGKGFFQVDHLKKRLEEADIKENGNGSMELQIDVGAPDKVFICKLSDFVSEEKSPQEAGVQSVAMEEDNPQEVGVQSVAMEEDNPQGVHVQRGIIEGKTNGEEEPPNLRETRECIAAEAVASAKAEPKAEIVKLQPDKWRQLAEIYPWIRPFHDDRRYLQLELQDLVVLPKQYYRLVENSFLLHGYYNYGHLVLARVCRRGLDKFYIGVPGNYYEREKQVAVLFGFESFEPKSESIREGEFGYYMIGVDI